MPADDANLIEPGLAALLAGLRAMLAEAMGRLAALAAGQFTGLSALETLAAAIAEKTDDLLWRTACTLAGRRDLLDLPPHLRRTLIRAARRNASSAALARARRRTKRWANPSPRFRALMPLIARDHRRYAAAIQRRVHARHRNPQPARIATPSAQRDAPRKLEPG